jgi:hypothetical protein
VSDDLPADARLMLEVEVLEGLAGRQVSGSDATLAAMALTGRDLALQAGDQIRLVGPGFRSRPIAQTACGIGEAWGFERPAQVCEIALGP